MTENKKNMLVVEGNKAVSYAAYMMSDMSFLFPITPATPMGEVCDQFRDLKMKNIFGQVNGITQLESESGAIGSVHGASLSGSFVSTFSSSQGLLLMVPNMLKIAGELLPVCLHVASRSISTMGLTIYCDYSDIMATRTTGWAFINSFNVQECHDIAIISHLATIKSRVPFVHFFDGFRTSHEMNKIEIMKPEQISPLVDWEAVRKHRERGLNPKHPITQSTVQGNDIYMQNWELVNPYYNELPDIIQNYMNEYAKITGRQYKIYEYVGHPEAEYVIATMGASCMTIEETIDYLVKKGEKVGLIKVRLFRPFSIKHLIQVIPKSCKYISVLDKTKEPGSIGEPLYLDFCALNQELEKPVKMYAGRFGLGGKEFTPPMVLAIINNMKSNNPKKHFTVGINDDVTNLSLEIPEYFEGVPEGTTQCLLWGFGSDGTVGSCHDTIRIIGENTNLNAQAYFYYDAHKAGGVTISHLRFGKEQIKSEYVIKQADYVACHQAVYVKKYPLLDSIKNNGIFVLNCPWEINKLSEILPGSLKRVIAEKNVKFYIINANKIAEKVGLGRRVNTIMQAVFFQISGILPYEEAIKMLESSISKTYKNKGEKVINMNIQGVHEAASSLIKVDVPKDWINSEIENKKIFDNEFYQNIVYPSSTFKGDDLPVSIFKVNGDIPNGLTKYEKRGIALKVPIWDSTKCVQCNMCSVVCPHAVIRPFVATPDEFEKAPSTFNMIDTKNPKGNKFRIQVSPDDCTGCEVCVTVCPTKSLSVNNYDDIKEIENNNWNFALTLSDKSSLYKRDTLIGSQFNQPLLEFSGACDGCGETPHMKMLTQLFGERMIVANASGCSSVWGGTWGSSSYTTNKNGHGPAYATSLFEDNMEYALGMAVSIKHRREKLKTLVNDLITNEKDTIPKEMFDLLTLWYNNTNDANICEDVYNKIKYYIDNKCQCTKDKPEKCKEFMNSIDLLPKISVWASGGDGWAYDIGYSGVDHVLSRGYNINAIVYDTQVYSNTGGQKSKASPTGAMTKFAASGVQEKPKDLGMMMMSYGNIYVASVSIHANPNQAIKAFLEAESYDGPSIVICYAPCREHGIAMSQVAEEAKVAVKCGYWPLYRYDPRLKKEGKNPFQLDSKNITVDIKTIMERENRFVSLMKKDKENATKLQQNLQETMKEKYEHYVELSK